MNHDIAGHFPDLESAKEYALGTAPNTSPEYHADRVRAIKHLIQSNVLINEQVNSRLGVVYDFGCGDGMYFKELGLHTESVIGIDISPHMITLRLIRFRGRFDYAA